MFTGVVGTTAWKSWEELAVIHWFLEFFEAVGGRCEVPGHPDFHFQGQVYFLCVSKEDRTIVLTAFPG